MFVHKQYCTARSLDRNIEGQQKFDIIWITNVTILALNLLHLLDITPSLRDFLSTKLHEPTYRSSVGNKLGLLHNGKVLRRESVRGGGLAKEAPQARMEVQRRVYYIGGCPPLVVGTWQNITFLFNIFCTIHSQNNRWQITKHMVNQGAVLRRF